MRKILLSVYFVATTLFSVNGQNKERSVDENKHASLQWGKSVVSSKATLNGVIGLYQSNYYVLKNDKKKYFIEKYDSSFNFLSGTELVFSDKSEYEYSVFLNNTIYVFSSNDSKQNEEIKLEFQKLNWNDLKLSSEIKEVVSVSYKDKKKRGWFNFKVSPDSSRFLIQAKLPYNSKDNEQFELIVLNNQMQQLWKNKFDCKQRGDLFALKHTRIDNKGNVYLLARIFQDKVKESMKGRPNYDYHLFLCRDNGKTFSDFSIDLKQKFITDMLITVTDSSNIIGGGFYSLLGTTSIKGVFYLSMNMDSMKIERTNFKEFPIEFISKNLSEKEKRRINEKENKGETQEMFEYDLDNLVLRNDGGAVLTGEQYFIRTNSQQNYYSGMSNTGTLNYYYNNDVIIVSINNTGEIDWMQKIPKNQVTTDEGYFSSYALCVTDKRLFLLFNDNPKNLSLKPGENIRSFNTGDESVVTLVSIDKDGKLKKEPLLNTKDANVLIRPKACEQIAPDALIVYGEGKKNQQLGKIIFPNE